MNTLRYGLTFLLHTLLLGLLPACGDDAQPEAPEPMTRREANTSVVDRIFLLQSAEGYTVLPGTTPRLSFDATNVRVYAGCNSIFGTYTVRDGTLVVDQLSETLVGCDAARHAQDTWLRRFLRERPELVLAGNDLTLTTPTATLHWLDRVIADPDRPLVGPTWAIDSFISTLGTASYLLTVKPTIVFAADGSVKVDTGCNTGHGTYRVEADQITLRDVAYTERGCLNERATKVEQLVQALIQEGTLTQKIEADELTLRRGDEGIIAHSP